MLSRLQTEYAAYAYGPAANVETVPVKQRDGQSLEPEPDTGSVRDAAIRPRKAEDGGELIAVVVERRYGRHRRACDRYHGFVLHLGLALVAGEQASTPPEEGIGRDGEAGLEAELTVDGSG